MTFASIASVLLALAVGLGAFGAHALKGKFDAYQMGIWEKAVFYHFVHALGLLIVSQMAAQIEQSAICWLLIAGIVLFSGSLYLLAFTGIPMLGAVTPFGGLAFIAAWLLLAFRTLRR